jgi:predicted  nucleic acid-binding Zn-ribbon protein
VDKIEDWINEHEERFPENNEVTETKKTTEMQKTKKTEQYRKKDRILILIFCFLVITCGCAIFGAVKRGRKAAAAAFAPAKEQTASAIEEEFYNLGFEKAEEDNHVSNRATLSIQDMKEVVNLEVLQVSDVEYVTTDTDENGEGITAILKIPGTGTYTVNLKEAEYVVDSERSYVLVRIPNPELTEFAVNYSGVEKILFKNNIFNDSISVGEELARGMVEEGELLIRKEFARNQMYYDSAKKSALNLIENMVYELNPDVENLYVDVEFY